MWSTSQFRERYDQSDSSTSFIQGNMNKVDRRWVDEPESDKTTILMWILTTRPRITNKFMIYSWSELIYIIKIPDKREADAIANKSGSYVRKNKYIFIEEGGRMWLSSILELQISLYLQFIS